MLATSIIDSMHSRLQSEDEEAVLHNFKNICTFFSNRGQEQQLAMETKEGTRANLVVRTVHLLISSEHTL